MRKSAQRRLELESLESMVLLSAYLTGVSPAVAAVVKHVRPDEISTASSTGFTLEGSYIEDASDSSATFHIIQAQGALDGFSVTVSGQIQESGVNYSGSLTLTAKVKKTTVALSNFKFPGQQRSSCCTALRP